MKVRVWGVGWWGCLWGLLVVMVVGRTHPRKGAHGCSHYTGKSESAPKDPGMVGLGLSFHRDTTTIATSDTVKE